MTINLPLQNNTFSNSPGNATVVLFGEVLADIFPDRTVLGGAPFNVARHLRAFCQNPVLITRLGFDEVGKNVLEVMAQNSMSNVGIQCSNRHPTGSVQVRLGEVGHHFDILPEQAYDYIHPAVVRMVALSANPSLIYFGTLSQRSPVSMRALKSLLQCTGAPKFLDLNLRAPWNKEEIIVRSLHDADVVKMNNDELSELTGLLSLAGDDDHSRADELVRRFNLEQVIVTCGEAGAWHINRNGKVIDARDKSNQVKVVDTVGAGDGFAAVCILGSLRQWPMSRTLERANAFAAALCEIRGAIPDHADFYEPYTRGWIK